MKIAPLTEPDFSAVITLWKDCGLTRPWNDPEKDMHFAMQGQGSTILVGKLAGEIVASVMVGHDGHRGVLYYLSAAPLHQGKGFGRAIHDAAIAWLQSKGVWKVNLLIRNDNERVRGFYERLGYIENNAISFGKVIAANQGST